MNMQPQFKTLVQNEMNRLRKLTVPPLQSTRQRYTESFHNATLIMRQLKNKGDVFTRMLRFLSFF